MTDIPGDVVASRNAAVAATDQNSGDLAGQEYWDDLYEPVGGVSAGWKPTTYGSVAMARQFDRTIRQARPASILEIGCGNSVWLPYLASQYGFTKVAGMDYSQPGCELAQQRLKAQGVAGEIYCRDLWTTSPEEVGQYDFVYSMGVVEHFTDTKACLEAIMKFVAPGGVLFTSVPNYYRSIHGCVARFWNPSVWRRHNPLGTKALSEFYSAVGMDDICVKHVGALSLGIVSWMVEPRFPLLAKVLVPAISVSDRVLGKLLLAMRLYRGLPALAPYVVAIAKRPAWT